MHSQDPHQITLAGNGTRSMLGVPSEATYRRLAERANSAPESAHP